MLRSPPNSGGLFRLAGQLNQAQGPLQGMALTHFTRWTDVNFVGPLQTAIPTLSPGCLPLHVVSITLCLVFQAGGDSCSHEQSACRLSCAQLNIWLALFVAAHPQQAVPLNPLCHLSQSATQNLAHPKTVSSVCFTCMCVCLFTCSTWVLEA